MHPHYLTKTFFPITFFLEKSFLSSPTSLNMFNAYQQHHPPTIVSLPSHLAHPSSTPSTVVGPVGGIHGSLDAHSPTTPPRTITSPITPSTATLNRHLHDLRIPNVEITTPLYLSTVAGNSGIGLGSSSANGLTMSTPGSGAHTPSTPASLANSPTASPHPGSQQQQQQQHTVHHSSVIHESHSVTPNIVAPYRSSSN